VETDTMIIPDNMHVTRSPGAAWSHDVRILVWNDCPIIQVESF